MIIMSSYKIEKKEFSNQESMEIEFERFKFNILECSLKGIRCIYRWNVPVDIRNMLKQLGFEVKETKSINYSLEYAETKICLYKINWVHRFKARRTIKKWYKELGVGKK